jgi:hypothetical protein
MNATLVSGDGCGLFECTTPIFSPERLRKSMNICNRTEDAAEHLNRMHLINIRFVCDLIIYIYIYKEQDTDILFSCCLHY